MAGSMLRATAISLMLIIILAFIPVASADSVTKSAGLGENTSGVGTIAWGTPTNIYVSDTVNATAYFDKNTDTIQSNYLKGTTFGFAIPSGATIDGILLEIQRKADGTTVTDQLVYIVKGGVIQTTQNKKAAAEWTLTDTYISYGSSTDLWGVSWTADDINAANFGAVLSVLESVNAIRTASVNHYRITVYYTPKPLPDLTPATYISYNLGKGGELFANHPNDIGVRINNAGSGNAGAFNVTLEIEGYTENKSIPSLAAGASTPVTFTGYAPSTNGSKIVNVTADKENAIAESNETNNTRSWTRTVYYNGYMGKRWTAGEDIVTVETYSLKGNITYSVGDSRYSSPSEFWNPYTANWSASDLSLPSGAIVQSARLYVSYCWDKTSGALWGDYTNFNGVTYPRAGASHYSDVKGWGTYATDAYGFVVYNVTADFNKSGNTVTLGDGGATPNVALDGMILQVVYSDANEPQRMIWINEGYDLLSASTTYGTDTNETIAYAPFTNGPAIDLAKVTSARLIAVGPGAGDTSGSKSNVIFNSNSHWDVLPPFKASTQIGIADIDVTSELNATSNEAAIQDNGDAGGMRAATVILVVEEGAASGPNVVVTQNNVSFGNITRGGTREIIASLTLNNTGTASANIVATFITSSGTVYGLTNATINVIGGSNFSIGPNLGEKPLSNANIPTAISTLDAGATVNYNAILYVPLDQAAGDYAGTVQITWS